MHPSEVTIENLRGSWRCRLTQDEYCDLSILHAQNRFLYDEIRNGERDTSVARVGTPKATEENKSPILILGDLRLEIFSLDGNDLCLKYPDTSKRIFKKFVG